ncbi:MAG: DUF11 domain-containing protein, partial [Lachnoclostridium sp.]|nr:DUF11 domain-containing protein [Lachnoclostridium sp.]
MATISGVLRYDGSRTAISSSALSGIPGIPIVLQNTATDDMIAVLTDANGKYTFTNVPNGNYRVVEAYGTPAVAAPGKFSDAVVGSPAVSAFPPISSIKNPTPGMTNLDATTPSTLVVNVNGADLTGQDILNGPVNYSPIQNIMDSNVVIEPANLITEADNGSFGTFAQGTMPNTGANPNPYPDIGSGFEYAIPNSAVVRPTDGQYTIQNLMTNAEPNRASTWWRIADHTSGNETGRMMVVNGSNPGAIFFQQQVMVTPNTYYLLSSWILNLSREETHAAPQLGVEVLGSDGQILYKSTLGALIPMNPNTPEWKQIGTVINSQNNSSLTVRFVSMGPAAWGNDYAIDDISLHEVKVPAYTPHKEADISTAIIGDIVNYTITLPNSGKNSLKEVTLTDLVPEGFSFIPNSVVVNGANHPDANPNDGFMIPDIPGGDTLHVTFSVTADFIPSVNPTINTAEINYSYTPVEGGIPEKYNKITNDVPVNIQAAAADLVITKTANTNPVLTGNLLTYDLYVKNNGPNEARDVIIRDDIPPEITNVEFSDNGGITWKTWNSIYRPGTMASGSMIQLLIRGTISPSATDHIINTATVGSSTPDPNSGNNGTTEFTKVSTFADLVVAKKEDISPIQPGSRLTYHIEVLNKGPNDANKVIITDYVPSVFEGAEYSIDNGTTWQIWNGMYSPGTIENGLSVSFLLRGTISDSAEGVITNTVTASSQTPDPNTANNSHTVITPINTAEDSTPPDPDDNNGTDGPPNDIPTPKSADLFITKQSSQNPVQVGNILTYTIAVTNNGPDEAEDVTVTDLIPNELTGAEYSLKDDSDWKPWEGSYRWGNLESKMLAVIRIRGTVNQSETGVLTNTAIVSSTTPDPNINNNNVVDITSIRTTADLEVKKSTDSGTVSPGNELVYTLEIKNNGPHDARKVRIIDMIPHELQNVLYSDTEGSTWKIWSNPYEYDTLAVGDSIRIFIRGTVKPSATGIIVNAAAAVSNAQDPNNSNNVDTVLTPIINSADLGISKYANVTSVSPGDVITYTINIWNDGPDDAQNVSLTDVFPNDITDIKY